MFPLWFRVALTVVLLHQMLQKGFQIRLPPLDAYLDPLLAMPIILHIVLLEKRFVFRKEKAFQLSGFEITLYTVLIAILAEGVFPFLRPNAFVADPMDAILYAAGAMWFYKYGNQPAKK